MIRFGLKEEVISQISGVFADFPEIELVLLYGSRAKGNFKNGSDIDLTMKGNQLGLTILSKISDALDELLLPYTIDLSIYDQIENLQLIEHIERVGVVFYQKLD